jgi:hypothetical protein
VRHEGGWGKYTRSLEEGWWRTTPPTAIIEVQGSSAQWFVAAMLLSVGYSPHTSYVFGAGFGADRFYTGFYSPSPIEWAQQRLRRRPSPVYLSGVKVSDDHWPGLERLAKSVPRVNEIAGAVDDSHAVDFVPSDTFGDTVSPFLKLMSSISKIDYCRQGIVWPPVKDGANWLVADRPPA